MTEMTDLDHVSGFQTFIKSWSLLLKGITCENAMYKTKKATQFWATWGRSLELGFLVGHLCFSSLRPPVTSLYSVVLPFLVYEISVKSSEVVSQLPWDGTPECPVPLLPSYYHFLRE